MNKFYVVVLTVPNNHGSECRVRTVLERNEGQYRSFESYSPRLLFEVFNSVVVRIRIDFDQLDPDPDPELYSDLDLHRLHSRIRIRIETIADPQHLFEEYSIVFPFVF